MEDCLKSALTLLSLSPEHPCCSEMGPVNSIYIHICIYSFHTHLYTKPLMGEMQNTNRKSKSLDPAELEVMSDQVPILMRLQCETVKTTGKTLVQKDKQAEKMQHKKT